MEGFLAKSDADVIDLFRGARFYEQYAALWNGRRGRRYTGIDAASNDYVTMLVANLWGESSRTIRRVDRDGQTVGVSPHPPSLESRAVFVITVLDALKGPHFAELIDSVIVSLSALWTVGKGDREDLVTLLDVLGKRGITQADAPFIAARQCLLTEPETDAEFRAVAEFCEKYPDAVSEAEREELKRSLQNSRPTTRSAAMTIRICCAVIASDIEYVGERLGVTTDGFTQSIYERADELETERAEREPPDDDDDGAWRRADSNVDDVRGMFEGLESALKGS